MRCHLCQAELEDGAEVMAGGMPWCPDLIECKYRARRRLGMSYTKSTAAKGNDYLAAGHREIERAEYVASLPPPKRNQDYDEYIASPEWQAFSNEQRLLARSRCEKCRTLAFESNVHHISYANFKNEKPQDVLVVCPICHRELDELRKEGRHPDVRVRVEGQPPRREVEWQVA